MKVVLTSLDSLDELFVLGCGPLLAQRSLSHRQSGSSRGRSLRGSLELHGRILRSVGWMECCGVLANG